jgi:D-amino peptidase
MQALAAVGREVHEVKSAFIITDLEGTAGVTSFNGQTRPDARYLDRSRRLASAEVNAAVDALVERGVDDILVLDGHGCEGLWYEDLHPAVKLMHGRPHAPHSVIDPIIDRYEAALIIGQHAMAGVRSGNLNHTQNSLLIDYIKINGKLAGEIAQWALYYGAAGLPFIFLSGETDACTEAQELIPQIETVSVKQGLGRNSAISVSPTQARRLIGEGTARAVERHRRTPVPPLVWPGPYQLEKRFFYTDAADAAADAPDAERVDDQTVRFRSEDIRSLVYR